MVQTVMLLLSGFSIMSTVLIAFVPVNLFFILTTTRSSSAHDFTALLNIAIFTLGGFFALTYFIRGARTLYHEPSENWKPAFLLGSIILMFVGTQLAWVLRPYFNYYPQFIRPQEGNFYTAVMQLVLRFAGWIGAWLAVLFGVFVIVWLFFRILAPSREERVIMSAEVSGRVQRALAKTCSQCGQGLSRNAKFCPRYGAKAE